jgi:hypothetical protein
MEFTSCAGTGLLGTFHPEFGYLYWMSHSRFVLTVNGWRSIKQREDGETMVILNIQQAARFLGKTPAALRNGYIRWGVPHFRLGGQIKFTQEALQEWVGKSMIETAAVPTAAADRRMTVAEERRKQNPAKSAIHL